MTGSAPNMGGGAPWNQFLYTIVNGKFKLAARRGVRPVQHLFVSNVSKAYCTYGAPRPEMYTIQAGVPSSPDALRCKLRDGHSLLSSCPDGMMAFRFEINVR